jgi:hypothetical protein
VVLAEIPRPDDTTANFHIFRHSPSKALLRIADKEGIATNLNPRDRPFDTAYFLGLDLGRRRSRANATHMTKRH